VLAAAATALLVAPQAAPAAPVDVLGASGKRGAAIVHQARCKYGVFGPRGVLQVGARPPVVRGANTRRRTRRERTSVRYRVYITNVFAGNTTLVASEWSGFIRVRQSQRRTWPGFTSFDMEWRGNYGVDIRIEWWNSKRMIGWRAYRINSFQFYDQYNAGPFGPISSCYKYTNY